MAREHKACYGTMCHDTLHFETNKEMNGKVFSFELKSLGLGHSDRLVKADISEWNVCLDCPEFDHCYKLCMAKLAFEGGHRRGLGVSAWRETIWNVRCWG